MFRVRGTVMAMIAGPSILLSAAPARAACVVDLGNAPYGHSESCDDFGFGYHIVAVTGVTRYEVYCGDTLRFTGVIVGAAIGTGATNGTVGCQATLRLTSLATGTTAYGVME